jgi:5'-nucleotidase
MKILLTNDDGIDSIPLHMLKKRFEPGHEVWIVAPDKERSGCSHSLTTINRRVKVRKTGDKVFACTGMPADCVLLAGLGLVPGKIDMVISGINYGPNLGTDIVYSGTAAAARQGAFMKIPSIAASLCTFTQPFFFEKPVEFLYSNLETLGKLWVAGTFINLNFPNVDRETIELAYTKPAIRIYTDRLEQVETAENEWDMGISSLDPGAVPDEDSDYFAVKAAKISLSIVNIFPENRDNNNKDYVFKFEVKP